MCVCVCVYIYMCVCVWQTDMIDMSSTECQKFTGIMSVFHYCKYINTMDSDEKKFILMDSYISIFTNLSTDW